MKQIEHIAHMEALFDKSEKAVRRLQQVLIIPTLMWWGSGMPNLSVSPIARIVIALVLAMLWLSFNVWSIVYMRHKSDGNPIHNLTSKQACCSLFLAL